MSKLRRTNHPNSGKPWLGHTKIEKPVHTEEQLAAFAEQSRIAKSRPKRAARKAAAAARHQRKIA